MTKGSQGPALGITVRHGRRMRRRRNGRILAAAAVAVAVSVALAACSSGNSSSAAGSGTSGGGWATSPVRLVYAGLAPTHIDPAVERVTLNPAVVTSARATLVVVVGADKAEAIGRIFGPERDPRRIPGQLAMGPGTTWILDEAAAAGLPGS